MNHITLKQPNFPQTSPQFTHETLKTNKINNLFYFLKIFSPTQQVPETKDWNFMKHFTIKEETNGSPSPITLNQPNFHLSFFFSPSKTIKSQQKISTKIETLCNQTGYSTVINKRLQLYIQTTIKKHVTSP